MITQMSEQPIIITSGGMHFPCIALRLMSQADIKPQKHSLCFTISSRFQYFKLHNIYEQILKIAQYHLFIYRSLLANCLNGKVIVLLSDQHLKYVCSNLS